VSSDASRANAGRPLVTGPRRPTGSVMEIVPDVEDADLFLRWDDEEAE
jgi:hypothetical protein